MSLTPTERAAYLQQAEAIATDGDGPVFCLATLVLDLYERQQEHVDILTAAARDIESIRTAKTTDEIPKASNGGTKSV